MNHTKEPWHVDEDFNIAHKGIGESVIATTHYYGEYEANARRIVACVNACAGMADPATELTAIRARVAEMESENKRLKTLLDGILDGFYFFDDTRLAWSFEEYATVGQGLGKSLEEDLIKYLAEQKGSE